MSHLAKRKTIFKSALGWDMLISNRVFTIHHLLIWGSLHLSGPLTLFDWLDFYSWQKYIWNYPFWWIVTLFDWLSLYILDIFGDSKFHPSLVGLPWGFLWRPKFQEALADCVHQVKDKSPWWLLAYSIFHQNSCETWIDLVQKRWGRWEDGKVIVCIFCVCILCILIIM